MKRKHPVKIKPNQHRGDVVASILRPASLALFPLNVPPEVAARPAPSALLQHLVAVEPGGRLSLRARNGRAQKSLDGGKLTFAWKSNQARHLASEDSHGLCSLVVFDLM